MRSRTVSLSLRDNALLADLLQEDIEAPGPCRATAFDVEDRVRYLLGLELKPLDQIRLTIDYGLKQAEQHAHCGVTGRVALGRSAEEERECFRFGVTHGQKARVGEDEGDRGDLRIGRVRLVEDRRRHEVGAGLLIEPARSLDFGHLFSRRHRKAQPLLDESLLFLTRVEEVEPNGLLAGASVLALDEPLAPRVVDREHAIGLALLPRAPLEPIDTRARRRRQPIRRAQRGLSPAREAEATPSGLSPPSSPSRQSPRKRLN